MSYPTLLRATLLAAALGGALSASAVTVQIATPNVTLVRPTSGSLTYDFVGVLAADPGTTIEAIDFSAPTDASHSDVLQAVLNDEPLGRSSYAGTLFSVTLDSTTPLGYYGYGATGGFRSYYEIDDSEGFAENYYSVTVTQAVPEPASLAALGLGALGLVRRRRARRA